MFTYGETQRAQNNVVNMRNNISANLNPYWTYPGRVAMSITLLAGWNVSDAMHQGTPATIIDLFSINFKVYIWT